MIFRNAESKDAKQILKIYDDAREYMKKSGNPEQWGDNHPPKSLVLSDIEEKINYVCEIDGEIAAVFMFVPEEDKDYKNIDGTWLNQEKCGTIHRIAVSDNMHGRGIAAKCFDFCVEMCRKHGLYNLKIDTHKDNIPMQKTLLKYGFKYCGTVILLDELIRMGYQYVIGE